MIRLWRHLSVFRHAGQAHGIDSVLTHRRPNSLAVRCPACPEPGHNISTETLEAADESER